MQVLPCLLRRGAWRRARLGLPSCFDALPGGMSRQHPSPTNAPPRAQAWARHLGIDAAGLKHDVRVRLVVTLRRALGLPTLRPDSALPAERQPDAELLTLLASRCVPSAGPGQRRGTHPKERVGGPDSGYGWAIGVSSSAGPETAMCAVDACKSGGPTPPALRSSRTQPHHARDTAPHPTCMHPHP